MNNIETMKLALEAMTYADACLKKQLTTKTKHEYAQDLLLEAGTALRQAINAAEQREQAQQAEPVGASEETQRFAIQVEKLLCEKLGRKWSPSGISIQTLVDELAGRQAQQAEPVAWITEWEGEYSSGKILDYIAQTRGGNVKYTPLYTSPPPRQPLTDEEADELVQRFARYELLRATEAAHGIKEKNT